MQRGTEWVTKTKLGDVDGEQSRGCPDRVPQINLRRGLQMLAQTLRSAEASERTALMTMLAQAHP
eukprot:5555978-Pleurochrysis_carterae.AAC.3